MPYRVGARVGPYEIVGPLGAGGMGEVYLARDTRLQRDIAIKTLPDAFTADPDRLSRFQREAQLLASLNHPNIAAIYGIEESDGQRALILELVDGETLAERLAMGPVPLEDAIPIANQIAAALEAAHERGIIHRDLKPANIKLTPNGRVKVLDFGLAKALDTAAKSAGDPANSPTLTAHATEVGLILGTAAYMAPEQARGKSVDRRADIWAFGAVLYEMLSGRRAFDGQDATEVIAKVITRDPDWTALPETTPPPLRRLLRRCLEKDPARRLHHITDARLELGDASDPAADVVPASPAVRGRWSAGPLLAVAAMAALFAVAGFLAGRNQAGTTQDNQPLAWRGERLGGSTVAMAPQLSANGQTLAFQAMVNGVTQVGVMNPQSGNWTVLTRDRARGPTQVMSWSKDGSRIYYDRYFDVPRGIFVVPVLGGDERLMLEDAMTPQALPDGSLLVTRINAERVVQLHRFWPDTGRVEALPALAAPLSRLPSPSLRVFPDGREAVFVGTPQGTEGADHLWIIDLASGRTRRIAPDITLTFAMWSFPLAISADGRSVVFILPAGDLQQVVMVPRDGSPGVRTLLTLTQRPVMLDVGPDGSVYTDQLTQPSEVFRYAPQARALERIQLPPTHEEGPVLPLPDNRLLLAMRTGGLDRIMVIAPGKEPVPFIDTQEETAAPMATLGRDKVVLLAGSPPNRRIAVASTASGQIVERLTRVDGNQRIGSIAGSPDGQTVFVVEGGTLWAVPANDGEPRKVRSADSVAVSPDGRELIIVLNEAAGIRLVRRTVSGGDERDVPIHGDIRLTPWPIAPNAVASTGHIVVRVTKRDSWFWPAAILDPRNGSLVLLPEAATTDMLTPGWDQQDRVVTIVKFTSGTLWRFTPVKAQ
jgi:eukaryotic-like serine/threonine-protein kinase